MRCGQRDYCVDGLRLVIVHCEHGTSHHAAHRVPNEYDRTRVWQANIASGTFGIVIEAQNICDGVIQIFRLIKQGLAVECSEVLVKVHREEVKRPLSVIQRILIRTNVFLEVVLGLGS